LQKIRAVILDFGGVVAEEGFREGLCAIARRCGLAEDGFFTEAAELAYSSGYVTGTIGEGEYWRLLKTRTGVALDSGEMRREVLSRFTLRPAMMEFASGLRARGVMAVMLTDQSNWLSELDAATPFLHIFDRVFNSFDMHRSKRDPALFACVTSEVGVEAASALFVDDNAGHVERARASGLGAVLFTTVRAFMAEARSLGLAP